MKHLAIGFTTAALSMAAAVVPGWAQAPRAQVPWTQQAQWAGPPGYPGYPLNAVTPEDAYRQGLINRWDYERLEGPLPQALQGPSANGEGSDSDGGGRR